VFFAFRECGLVLKVAFMLGFGAFNLAQEVILGFGNGYFDVVGNIDMVDELCKVGFVDVAT